jgi:GT2 family glycosyltransferase
MNQPCSTAVPAAASPSRQQVDASVVVASRNRPALLRDAVASILEGTALPVEIVVIDQSDAPLEAIERLAREDCPVRHIHSPTRGLSRENNLGATAAKSDLLVFTHDDVRVDREWLATLVAKAASAGAEATVTGRVLAAEVKEGWFAPSLMESTVARTFAGRAGIEKLYPMNMAIPRRLFDSVGGFDPRIGPGTDYPAAEDNDLCYRLLRAGSVVVYEPGAIVYHRAWRSERERNRLRYDYGRGQGAYYAKHLSLRDRTMLRRALNDVVRRSAYVVVQLVRSPRRVPPQAAFLVGLLKGMTLWTLREGHRAPVETVADVSGGMT